MSIEKTANPIEITHVVNDFLDYINAIKDISGGLKFLTPVYIIDEAIEPMRTITGGQAFRILENGLSTSYRKPLIGRSLTHPRSTKYIILRTESKDPENEKAPYMQPFWVEISNDEELGQGVDDNWDRRREPLTKGAYSGLNHKEVNDRFNETIISAFAPRSSYEHSFWLPTNKFSRPSLVMFAYPKEGALQVNSDSGIAKSPYSWFAKDYQTGAIIGAAYTIVADIYPDFQSGDFKPLISDIAKENLFEVRRRHMDEAIAAYFDGISIDGNIARDIYAAISVLIPQEYQKWVTGYFAEFFGFLETCYSGSITNKDSNNKKEN